MRINISDANLIKVSDDTLKNTGKIKHVLDVIDSFKEKFTNLVDHNTCASNRATDENKGLRGLKKETWTFIRQVFYIFLAAFVGFLIANIPKS